MGVPKRKRGGKSGPKRVSFAVLRAELDAHGLQEAQPYAMGFPGRWIVGFVRDQDWLGRATKLYDPQRVADLEVGWAALLHWIREREYAFPGDPE